MNINWLFLFLLISSILIQCKEEDKCNSIICYNSGVCFEGKCQCAAGYFGEFCENADPCYDVECFNGGRCEDGGCKCPTNFRGPKCEIYDPVVVNPFTADSVDIQEITILKFPATNNGADWDDSGCGQSEADVYLTLEDQTGILFTSLVKQDCDPSLSYDMSQGLPVRSRKPFSNFILRLYDKDDGACAPDDPMVANIKKLHNAQIEFQDTIYFDNSVLDLRARMVVSYYY